MAKKPMSEEHVSRKGSEELARELRRIGAMDEAMAIDKALWDIAARERKEIMRKVNSYAAGAVIAKAVDALTRGKPHGLGAQHEHLLPLCVRCAQALAAHQAKATGKKARIIEAPPEKRPDDVIVGRVRVPNIGQKSEETVLRLIDKHARRGVGLFTERDSWRGGVNVHVADPARDHSVMLHGHNVLDAWRAAVAFLETA
jgi:hypothetical protein